MNGCFSTSEKNKIRFSKRIGGEVILSADIYATSNMTESAATVKLIIPDEDYLKGMELYDRICQFVLLHGEDLQGMFQTEKYQYMSFFVRDIDAFKKEFENEEILKPLFNHGHGETAEFLISFPESLNYDDKEDAKNSFIRVIQEHVVTLSDSDWNRFKEKALSGRVINCGININTGEISDPEKERNNIINLSRTDFVKSNLTEAFEPDFYVNTLLDGADEIGEINGHSVWFNSDGFYIYWNADSEYLLESWLTYPAYPRGR